jgi:hypothetical protein
MPCPSHSPWLDHSNYVDLCNKENFVITSHSDQNFNEPSLCDTSELSSHCSRCGNWCNFCASSLLSQTRQAFFY